MILTDVQIGNLLREPKPRLDPAEFLRAHAARPANNGHRRHAIDVPGDHGNAFVLSVRQSSIDPYDFSVILTYVFRNGTTMNLRRHNGPSHSHRNPLEGEAFAGKFHVHEATERYQRHGGDAEHYAWPTDTFADLATALSAMLVEAQFEPPAQLSIDLPQ